MATDTEKQFKPGQLYTVADTDGDVYMYLLIMSMPNWYVTFQWMSTRNGNIRCGKHTLHHGTMRRHYPSLRLVSDV